MTENYRIQNPEVLYAAGAITVVQRQDIDGFKHLAEANPRKRIRLCTHADAADALHEMLIVHDRNAYVRPHKHPGKSESIHVVEGSVDLVLFDEDGRIGQVVQMGDYRSGLAFYFRMDQPRFHTLIIRSELLVFHEVTNGPFDRSDTVFASWAPQDQDCDAVQAFQAELNKRLAAFPLCTRTESQQDIPHD